MEPTQEPNQYPPQSFPEGSPAVYFEPGENGYTEREAVTTFMAEDGRANVVWRDAEGQLHTDTYCPHNYVALGWLRPDEPRQVLTPPPPPEP